VELPERRASDMSTPTSVYLFRRSNGIYYVQYFVEGRIRYKSTGCTKKADAVKLLPSFKELTAQKPKDKSLSAFTGEFLTHAKATFRFKTVELYERSLWNFLNLSGDVDLCTLSPRHLDVFKASRLKSNFKVTRSFQYSSH
jgi:hypothetical protein